MERLHFLVCCSVRFLFSLVVLCCVWVLWRENRWGGIIGNDQRRRNAWRREMVWRVRKGKESENAGILEQRREWIEHRPHSVEGLIMWIRGGVNA